MADWRDHVAIAPLIWLMPGSAVFTGVFFGASMWLLTPDMSGLAAAALGICFGVFCALATMYVVTSTYRPVRTAGHLSLGDRQEVLAALRCGRAPSETALDGVALAQIKHRRERLQRAGKSSFGLLGALAVVEVLAAVASRDVIFAGTACLLIGALISTPAWTARARSGLERAESAIRVRDGATAASAEIRLGRARRILLSRPVYMAGYAIAAVGWLVVIFGGPLQRW